MKIKVPFCKQKNLFYCGPACLQMVFSFFGKRESQENIAHLANTSPQKGTSRKNMGKATAGVGFSCCCKNNSTIGEIKRFIKLGLPVIVSYTEPTTEEGHYAVVVGYTARKLILNDPFNGKEFSIKNEDFVSRWYDHERSRRFKRWIMIVKK